MRAPLIYRFLNVRIYYRFQKIRLNFLHSVIPALSRNP